VGHIETLQPFSRYTHIHLKY